MAKLITIVTFILLVINKQASAGAGASLEAASMQMFLAMVFAVALLFAARGWVKDFIEG